MSDSIVKLVGDWAAANETFAKYVPSGRFNDAIQKATHQEALFFQSKLKEGIKSGAPGGKAYKPHSPATLAIRRAQGFDGTKILIRSATLLNNIVTVKNPGGGYFVGVRRKAQGKTDLVNIALIQEEGFTSTKPMTERQRRWFFAMIRKGGLEPDPSKSGGRGHGLVLKIPARPTFGPVFEKYGQPDDVRDRFWKRVAKLMGKDVITGRDDAGRFTV